MMKKLISMTDFVLEQNDNINETNHELLQRIVNYALFIKQPLMLGMFVPCEFVDGVWVVLEDPIETDCFLSIAEQEVYEHELFEYDKAKERVLFEGKFEVHSERQLIRFNNLMQPLECLGLVENIIKYNLILTESAKKQIGL